MKVGQFSSAIHARTFSLISPRTLASDTEEAAPWMHREAALAGRADSCIGPQPSHIQDR